MEKYHIWTLSQDAARLMAPYYTAAFENFAKKLNLDTRLVGLILAAVSFEPETISPERMIRRNPYSAELFFLRGMELVRNQGVFEQVKPGEFALTTSARIQTQELLDELSTLLAELDILPVDESRWLAGALGKLVQAMLDSPPPPDTWSIRSSYKLMPSLEPSLPYIEQACSCLNAYRDDCHLYSWRKTGISATTLEALTFLWRGEATSLDELFQKLERRSHPREVYTVAFDELRKIGYMEGRDDAPVLTAQGKGFREMVEQETDRLFFKPWDCLTTTELDRMEDILILLCDKLKK